MGLCFDFQPQKQFYNSKGGWVKTSQNGRCEYVSSLTKVASETGGIMRMHKYTSTFTDEDKGKNWAI